VTEPCSFGDCCYSYSSSLPRPATPAGEVHHNLLPPSSATTTSAGCSSSTTTTGHRRSESGSVQTRGACWAVYRTLPWVGDTSLGWVDSNLLGDLLYRLFSNTLHLFIPLLWVSFLDNCSPTSTFDSVDGCLATFISPRADHAVHPETSSSVSLACQHVHVGSSRRLNVIIDLFDRKSKK